MFWKSSFTLGKNKPNPFLAQRRPRCKITNSKTYGQLRILLRQSKNSQHLRKLPRLSRKRGPPKVLGRWCENLTTSGDSIGEMFLNISRIKQLRTKSQDGPSENPLKDKHSTRERTLKLNLSTLTISYSCVCK